MPSRSRFMRRCSVSLETESHVREASYGREQGSRDAGAVLTVLRMLKKLVAMK